jgi:hypothetical protein
MIFLDSKVVQQRQIQKDLLRERRISDQIKIQNSN